MLRPRGAAAQPTTAVGGVAADRSGQGERQEEGAGGGEAPPGDGRVSGIAARPGRLRPRNHRPRVQMTQHIDVEFSMEPVHARHAPGEYPPKGSPPPARARQKASAE